MKLTVTLDMPEPLNEEARQMVRSIARAIRLATIVPAEPAEPAPPRREPQPPRLPTFRASDRWSDERDGEILEGWPDLETEEIMARVNRHPGPLITDPIVIVKRANALKALRSPEFSQRMQLQKLANMHAAKAAKQALRNGAATVAPPSPAAPIAAAEVAPVQAPCAVATAAVAPPACVAVPAAAPNAVRSVPAEPPAGPDGKVPMTFAQIKTWAAQAYRFAYDGSNLPALNRLRSQYGRPPIIQVEDTAHAA